MPENTFTHLEHQIINAAIQNLLTLGAIAVCEPDNDQFISKIFLAPKKDGGHRFILNLKSFNNFVQKLHFKMEDYHTAAKLVYPGVYMAYKNKLICPSPFRALAKNI